MEKPTKRKQNLDRMMSRLEAHSITDPLVKMILKEVSELYGGSPDPDFEIHYLDNPMEFKYRTHSSPISSIAGLSLVTNPNSRESSRLMTTSSAITKQT